MHLQLFSEKGNHTLNVTHMDDVIELIVADRETGKIFDSFMIEEHEWEVLTNFLDKLKNSKKT